MEVKRVGNVAWLVETGKPELIAENGAGRKVWPKDPNIKYCHCGSTCSPGHCLNVPC